MALTDLITGGNSSKAAGAYAEAVDLFKNLKTPEIEDMKIELEEMVLQGQITPEEAATYLQEQSAMNGIQTDPALMQAQMDALTGLQDVASSGGLTAADRSQLSQIQNEENTAQRGNREAILSNAAERGVSGGGLELMQQMQNQQQSAGRQSQRDMDVAGMAQQRALEALQQAGNLGGQIQQTQFGQKAQVAGANDAINQFNTQAKQNQSNLNTQNRNNAQETNLNNRQSISNNNTDIRNTQEKANKGLFQQDFSNQLSKTQGVAGALGNQAAGFQQAGAATSALIGSALGAAGAMSDERSKENIEDFDPSEFLDSLTGYKFNYKKKSNGEGRHAGVMAQDLEKTDVGRAMVKNTPEGKMVDYGKGFGALAASLASLNQEVKKLKGK